MIFDGRTVTADTPTAPGDAVHATIEEIAVVLSEEEGRVVTPEEVRRIEFQALRKLRQILRARGLTPDNLLPDR